ncbi:MAG: MtrB/PioB family outer membrane beta-barrel protein [Elusimicrobia bacterium]|nr:MtrB/PioB family outer membrane beta-barrel protein [Elusimicrobiota bacterium]
MSKILRVSMALALTLTSTPAWATLSQEVSVKVQQRIQRTEGGGQSAQAEEYGEFRNGLVLEKYQLDFENEKYVIDVEASNVGLNNQSLRAEGGQPGKMTWKVGWDNLPHLFSTEAKSLYMDAGNGNLVLPGAYRKDTTGAAFTNSIKGPLPYVPLGYDVETGNLDLKFHPAHDFTVDMGVMRQTKRGTKATTGSFGFSNAVELAAPIDWLTHEAYLELQKADKDSQIAFIYRLSDFQNNIPNLYWDNPYRATNRYSSSSGYSTGDQSARGGQAMDASNKAHSLKLEGGVNLPLNSRFSGEAGYQLWTARNAMMFYTTNAAIHAGSAMTDKPPFDASRTAPDNDVVGKMEVFTYMGKLASRPFHWLRAAVSHEAYIMENKSTQYDMPGFAIFDQIWHVENVRTPREQFRDDKTALSFDYDITDWLSGGTDLKHIYKKQTREIPKLREYEFEQGFTIRPSRELFVNLSALHSERRGNGMDLEHYPTTTSTITGKKYLTDHPGLRRIDVADRNRNQGRVQVQWTPGESSLGASARITDDKYRQGKGDPTGGNPYVYPELFGTESEQAQAFGLDFSVPVLGSVVVDGFYEYDYTKRYMRSSQTICAGNTTVWVSSKTYGAGIPGEGTCGFSNNSPATIMTGDPATQWVNRTTDQSHIAGLGVTWTPLQKLKTFFGYDLTMTVQNVDAMYSGAAVNQGTNGADDTYGSFPKSRRVTQTFRTKSEYQILKDLTFVANYAFEKFYATDFGWDRPVRDGNTSLFLGANPVRNFSAHSMGAGLNYKF